MTQNQTKPKKRVILKVFLLLISLGVAVYGGLIGWLCWQEAHPEAPGPYDAIIVLGAQVLPDGTPQVQLEWRLLEALTLYQGSPAPIVVCGAQGADEPRPEAEVMRDWLIERGVPAESILTDANSFNTRENIQNAVSLLSPYDVSAVRVVTSDYHLPRALALCRDEGLAATGNGSSCRPEFIYWAKNHGREALSWVKYWLQKYL